MTTEQIKTVAEGSLLYYRGKVFSVVVLFQYNSQSWADESMIRAIEGSVYQLIDEKLPQNAESWELYEDQDPYIPIDNVVVASAWDELLYQQLKTV